MTNEQLALKAAIGYVERNTPQLVHSEIAAELRRLDAVNAQLLEALKSANLFLHHCWCDVQMNEYSYEKLQQEMAAVLGPLERRGSRRPTTAGI